MLMCSLRIGENYWIRLGKLEQVGSETGITFGRKELLNNFYEKLIVKNQGKTYIHVDCDM